MIDTVIIASSKRDKSIDFDKYLSEKLNSKVQYTYCCKTTLDSINKRPILLIIDDLSDFNSVKLVQKAITINAFIIIAIMGNLSPKNFGDKFEGLGILMQLSDPPSQSEISSLCKRIAIISTSFL